MGDCGSCLARQAGICRALAPEKLEGLSALGRRRRLRRGASLLREGEESGLVANLLSGALKLTASTADGREQIVGLAWAGDFLGRPFGRVSATGAVALADAELCLFPRAAFEAFAAGHPELQRDLLERTLAELDRARALMLLLARKSAGERVASLLLELADRGGGDTVALPFGRQQMADLLGLTIETVSRQLTRLKENGIIALPERRSLVIAARAELERLAEAA